MAATVLVPIFRTWSFVLDCLTLFCAPAFLTTQAAHVAKQIGAYADYATTYVKDGDLRGAMKAIYPGVARMSNEDIVEMLMRAGVWVSHRRFNVIPFHRADQPVTTAGCWRHLQLRPSTHTLSTPKQD
jgi:hypothetical protein